MSDRHTQLMRAYDELANWYDAMYEAMGLKQGAYKPTLVDSFSRLLADLGGTTVLDCSCGTGDPVIGLAKHCPHLTLVGTDANAKMLGRCALNALAEGVAVYPIDHNAPDGIKLGQCTWQELSAVLSGYAFDFVMCRGHSIYHLMSRAAIVGAIQSMIDVTAPGGYIFLDMIKWTSDLRGEVGREDIMFRGWLPPEHPRNPTGQRLIFMNSLHFDDMSEAVSGIRQTKTLFVQTDQDDTLHLEAIAKVEGATFTVETLCAMAEEAGLRNVHVLPIEGQRYTAMLGQKEA